MIDIPTEGHMELTYADTDEDGTEYPHPNKPVWKSTAGMGYQDLLQEAFRLCSYGNKQSFGSFWEQKTWRKICRKLDKGVIPVAWVEAQLERVRELNKHRVVIIFAQFESMVLNLERQKDWEAKNRMALGNLSDIIEEGHDDIID